MLTRGKYYLLKNKKNIKKMAEICIACVSISCTLPLLGGTLQRFVAANKKLPWCGWICFR
jgi:hypothetical protein